MLPDDVQIYPPYTAQERRDVEHMTDPKRDWPTMAEAEEDARRPDCCRRCAAGVEECETCEEEP